MKTQRLVLSLGGSLELVRIPAGTFLMGSDTGGDDEKPVHKVTLTKPFYMGKFPVTQEQYQQVMGVNPSHFKGEGNLPVECVSWNDAQEFCKKLSALNAASGQTVRLPTEAEWEYACRAGSKTAYCFGDDENRLGDYAWYNGNSDGKTHPVGLKKPNVWGLYDMHGNVWEWCQDWHGDYLAKPVKNPIGPPSGASRVLRGGAWFFVPWICRSAGRCWINPVDHSISVGFRVVVVPASRTS